MKLLDRLLQRWRIWHAAKYIPSRTRLLDIGCGDGRMLRQLRRRIREGVGIDPDIKEPIRAESYQLLRGRVPDQLPALKPFDTITMLAVLEHLRPDVQAKLDQTCRSLLKPGGRLIITVPSPQVDQLVHLLQRWRLLAGTHVEQHYGFNPHQTPAVFSSFRLIKSATFQLGLNHLFVFDLRRTTQEIATDPVNGIGNPKDCVVR